MSQQQPLRALEREMTDAARAAGLVVSAEALTRIAAYASSLWAWNQKLNLTRHTDAARFVSRDLADALAIAPHLAYGEHVLDVGTGGGVPGVLVAILRPDLRVELSDSVGKRARAVASIVGETGLSLPVHAEPAQQVVVRGMAAARFDTLLVRAVAPLAKLLGWFEPLAERFGRLLVIKGPRWEEEKKEARHKGFTRRMTVRRIAAWPLAGTDSESVLLEIKGRES